MTAVAAGTLVGMYVIDLVGKLADAVEPLRDGVRLQVLRLGDPGRDRPARLRRADGRRASLLAAAGALLFERRDVL